VPAAEAGELTDRSPGAPTAVTPPRGITRRGKAKRTRISGVWVAVIAAAIFLILLIVFVAQNSRNTSVHFLGWSGHMSVALVILLSGVCGILIAAIPGTIRIFQLRRVIHRSIPNPKPR
jgi:uncharacterized integral membrane protein